MSSQVIAGTNSAKLRSQAVSRLTGRSEPDGVWPSASAALGVLHELASSPATAADALALLHELQVHQVELDLQAEELRRSRAELEEDLKRQTQLYDFAPASCFAVDSRTTVHALNLTGARLLGLERDSVPGRTLDSFLAPRGSDSLQTLLARVGGDHLGESCMLELKAGPGKARSVHASACADPAGSGFLVALVDMGGV